MISLLQLSLVRSISSLSVCVGGGGGGGRVVGSGLILVLSFNIEIPVLKANSVDLNQTGRVCTKARFLTLRLILFLNLDSK